MQKMREYERKVLAALGLEADAPALLVDVDLVHGYVAFGWYGTSDPVVPTVLYQPGVEIHALAAGEAVQYRVPANAVTAEVWALVVAARAEWAANFPRIHP